MTDSQKIIVMGSYRLPLNKLDEARPMMARVIAATRAEAGCISYDFAQDSQTPGLIRVSEIWQSREHLAAHFATPHMAIWRGECASLGVSERNIVAYTVGGEEVL